MAVTNGTMTSLPTSQTIYLQTVEESETNRISFRDSLKFFQEQLAINGASFPSPTSTCRTGSDSLRKNGSRFCKEQIVDNNGKTTKDSDMFGNEIQTVRSCKISIPTVDTILESVRVLRAIQKSQEERGSTWHLDVSAKSDIESEFQLTEDWIHVSDLKYEEYSQEKSNCVTTDTSITNSTNVQSLNHQNEITNTSKQEVNNVNGSCTSEDFSNINGTFENFSNTNNSSSSDDFNNAKDTCTSEVCNDVNDTCTSEVCNDVNDTCTSEVCNDANESNASEIPSSNPVNEICSFWPSHILTNEKYLDKESTMPDLSFSVELKEDKAEFHVHNVKAENDNREESDTYTKVESIVEYENNFINQNGINETEGVLTKNLENYTKSENSNLFETKHANITVNNENVCNTPDSLSIACKELLDYVNVENLSTHTSNEILNHESNPTIGILKIETYEDIDTQKQEVFLFNDSIWKDSCSPSSNNSTKIENNDSDSGIGTQRSASSLSPNNPNNTQKDSWSDTCSSHYASAECSPYHSLTSVFDASLGLNIPAFSKEVDNGSSIQALCNELENIQKKVQENETISEVKENISSSPGQRDFEAEIETPVSEESLTNTQAEYPSLENEGIEQDTEGSYCFVSNYTLESPNFKMIAEPFKEVEPVSEDCDISPQLPKTVNDHKSENDEQHISDVNNTESVPVTSSRDETIIGDETIIEDEPCDVGRIQKFTAASCDLISIVNTLYSIKESPAFQVLPADDEKFEETLFILSKGAFCVYPEDNYLVTIEDSILHISKDSQILLSLNMKYGEVSFLSKNTLKVDNRLGRCVFIRCDPETLVNMKTKIEQHCLKHWQSDCLQLVHYPLKCHQNVIIIDLGSCSTRAGILMDQPTLPRIFFPTICATDRSTGKSVYGMEALHPEVRQHSNLSFPVRPSIKITKHTIDIDLLEGLFQKIFTELRVDPTQYTVQVCLPRNLSINAQNALVKLLLESLQVKGVSLTNQALLTLYAHDVSTAVVVDIGDRTDVLPVVDGFIVETGVTKLPHGGQRLIHHMKHGLAEKRISLSNDIDSFVVQYIIENLAYVAEDYDTEQQIVSKHLDVVKKTLTLQPSSSESITCKSITLDEARFNIPEGLFNPELWGLDSPGIHHLVQKAIQATSVDARKRIAENIYVSGGVTMLPGFVERLNKEVTKLSKAKIIPKVYASNYRYHCTYIGACKFANMKVFPQVCINLDEYTKDGASALKKCALFF